MGNQAKKREAARIHNDRLYPFITKLHPKLDVKALKQGDHVAHVWEGLAIYATIKSDLDEGEFMVEAFSVACEHGEHGMLDPEVITTKLTQSEWDYCQSMCWPNDPIAHNMIRSNHSP